MRISLALLPVLFFVLCSSALAFPDYDGQREAALLGDGHSRDGLARGTFLHDDRGLWLKSPHPVGSLHYWLPKHPQNWLDDGMLRVRVRPGSRMDLTILFRATVPEDLGESLSAYGLSLTKDKITWHRWDQGITLSMDESVTVPGLSRRSELEVVIFMVGPQLVGLVYDASTLKQLASLTLRDPAYSGGKVGIRAYRKQDTGTVITWMSVMGEGAGWWSPEALDDDAALGSDRLMLFSPDQIPQVPPALSDLVLLENYEDRAGERHAAALVSPVQAEQLRRAGITPSRVTGDLPWWTKDANYRRFRRKPVTKTAQGFELHDSYKNPRMVEEILRGYHERYPTITRLVELGRTHLDHPILALRVTDNLNDDENEPAVLLNGAHHGSELLSIDYALDALALTLERSGDPSVRRWIDALDLWFIPLVNPDGNYIFTEISRHAGRKNGRDNNEDGVLEPWEGVDLNRNYPFQWGALGESGSRGWNRHYRYRGTEPASEPEVQAIIALADKYHFVADITWHTLATKILVPYTIDRVENPSPDAAWKIAEDLLPLLPIQPNGRRFKVARNLYSVDGTDQDWHYHAHGTVAYIVEGSHHNPLSASKRRLSIQGLRPFYVGLLDRILDGPTLSGNVVDEQGRPVQAQVHLDEVVLKAGERWTSRRSDGRFDRLVAQPGTYTLRASAPGFRATTRKIEVEGSTMVRVVLVRE